MDSVKHTVNWLKYNWGYFRVSVTRKYYSPSGDPRVVQNRKKFSLRTYSREEEEQDEDEDEDEDQQDVCSDVCSEKRPEGPPLPPRTEAQNLLQVAQNKIDRLRNLEHELRKTLHHNSGCDSRRDTRAIGKLRSFSFKRRYHSTTDIPLIPSPIIELDTAASRASASASSRSTKENYDSRPAPAWKKVLSEASLSAAQITSGARPRSSSDFSNLSADLTVAEPYYDVISLYY